MLNHRPMKQFKKDYKQQWKRGKDLRKIDAIMQNLIDQLPLDPALKDHPLTGDWKDFRELHIEPDWLLIYKIDNDLLIFVRTGTHADLFEE